MGLEILTLGSSKTYTRESLLGGGAVVGKNVTISSITPIDGGNKVTFSYTLDDGTVKTSSMNVMDGKDGIDGTNGKNGKDGQPGKDGSDGIGISKIEKIGTVDLVDTYRITFTDNSTFDYEVTNGADGQGGTGGSGTAEDTTYTNENFPQYDNVDLALDALFNKVYYVKPNCSLSATPSGGTFEMGTTITAPITFTWTTNKSITSQTLTNCTLADETVRTATYDTDISSDKSFTLTVSDSENSASSTVSYKFLNKIHFGCSVEPTTYDSNFILGLANGKLTSSNKATYSFNCESGEYAYFATVASMKVTSAWVNGFQADLEEVASVNHTNASGYTTSYVITRFRNASLGSFSAEVK